jgi:uncharacterized membrane protein YdbT with pleckstrin-like domain
MPAIELFIVIVVLGWLAVVAKDTVLFLPIIILALVILFFTSIRPFLRWLTTDYVFTNRRIITRKGLIARSGRDMPLSKVNNISFQVPFLGRVLNYGHLQIESASNDPDGDLKIDDVPNVEKIQKTVYVLMEENEDRRRNLGPGSGYDT